MGKCMILIECECLDVFLQPMTKTSTKSLIFYQQCFTLIHHVGIPVQFWNTVCAREGGDHFLVHRTRKNISLDESIHDPSSAPCKMPQERESERGRL